MSSHEVPVDGTCLSSRTLPLSGWGETTPESCLVD
jgi:hypothetical protein